MHMFRTNGQYWSLVRVFRLLLQNPLKTGIEVPYFKGKLGVGLECPSTELWPM